MAAPGIDLGNITRNLRLWCRECKWLPPGDLQMALVEAHYGMEHPDAEKITLDMLPVCVCGKPMESTVTRPTGGGFKDYFSCPACGSTGFAIRKDSK